MELNLRNCSVCLEKTESSVFSESNYDASKLDAFSYASRKFPELMHFRLLRCHACDALYASPAPVSFGLAEAYDEALFDSDEEARYASYSYARQLSRIRLPDKKGALDIGTGDGAFLSRLIEAGFENVQGVEPSQAPIRAAQESVKPLIRHGIFSGENYAEASLSLITCFQTMEHLAEPRQVAEAALKLLKPGGAFFTVCHNHRSLSAKLLGKKSPIFDIEHLQLFSKKSLRRLFELSGYRDVEVYAISNTYPLHYWMKVFPLPKRLKKIIISASKFLGLGYIPVPLRAGNMVAFGYKK